MSIIKYWLSGAARTLLVFCMRIANAIIPKDDELFLFHSVPDFSDNARALYEYLREKRPGLRLVWVVEPHMLTSLRSRGVDAVAVGSFEALLTALRAKVLITTHSYGSRWKSRRQLLVNVWHGMPLKRMGPFDPGETRRGLRSLSVLSSRTDLLIASSELMRVGLVGCFGISPDKVKVTGQPRNDRLYEPQETARSRLAELVGMDLGGRAIALYAPTFRRGLNRVDGISPFAEGGLLERRNLESVDSFLRSRHAVMIVNAHPLDSPSQLHSGYEAVRFLTRKPELLWDMSEILGAVDVLVTDYSGIYIDFLLLDRPIVFAVPDLEEYRKSRGFLWEPFDFWTPGPKVSDIATLLSEIDRCLEDTSYYRDSRRLVNQILNAHRNDQSCKRVYEEIYLMARKVGL